MTTKTRLTELQSRIIASGNRLAAKTLAPLLPVPYTVRLQNGREYGMQRKENNFHQSRDYLYFSVLDTKTRRWVNLEHSAQVDLQRELLRDWPELLPAILTETERLESIEQHVLADYSRAAACEYCYA